MEGVIAREVVASAYKPPPAFCTKAKIAKGGAYLRDTTVLSASYIILLASNSVTVQGQLNKSL